jgi:uncharacterized repeat protein (TIGR02543 family)
MKKFIFTMGFTALMSGAVLNAQVTIGQNKSPEPFSVLELISNNTRGLRLPQMSNTEKATAFGANNATLIAAGIDAMGLQIFNTTAICVETWNGTAWILTCAPITVTYYANGGTGSDISVETENSYITGNSYTVENNTFTRTNYAFIGWNTEADGSGTNYTAGASINLVADLTLYAQWVVIPAPNATTPLENTYVGAFWRNDQTGERLIRIPVGNSAGNLGNWSAVVVDGDFIIMDKEVTDDPNVDWATISNTPADMNIPANDAMYHLSGNATSVYGTVVADEAIYFRIGLTFVNPNSEPRYGRILLSYNNNTKFRLNGQKV